MYNGLYTAVHCMILTMKTTYVSEIIDSYVDTNSNSSIDISHHTLKDLAAILKCQNGNYLLPLIRLTVGIIQISTVRHCIVRLSL